MVKGSIIFHKTLLWGIVTKVENDFFTIYFESFGERVISKEFIDLDKKMLVEIPEEFVNGKVLISNYRDAKANQKITLRPYEAIVIQK